MVASDNLRKGPSSEVPVHGTGKRQEGRIVKGMGVSSQGRKGRNTPQGEAWEIDGRYLQPGVQEIREALTYAGELNHHHRPQ